MKILIVSKCPTHPVNAGNRAWIVAQANILKQLGNEVHFLYIQELPMRKNTSTYLEDYKQSSKYWNRRLAMRKSLTEIFL